MATKHVPRLPYKRAESVPSTIDMMLLPTNDGRFVLANLAQHTIDFKGKLATYRVNPVPVDRQYGPHIISRAVEDSWEDYAIYRAASVKSSGIDLSMFGVQAVAFSPTTMRLMLLVESHLRTGGYHRIGRLQPIPILEASIVS